MAISAFSTEIKGNTYVKILYQGQKYSLVQLGALDHLCCYILLEIDYQAHRFSIVFKNKGDKTTLTVCGFTTIRTKSLILYKNLTADCHPVAARSRKYSLQDCVFVNKEVRRLLKEGIIDPVNRRGVLKWWS